MEGRADPVFDYLAAAVSSAVMEVDGVKQRVGGPIWAIFDADAVTREEWEPRHPFVDIENGYFFRADTLEELARALAQNTYQKVPVQPAALRETVTRYNSFVDTGSDPDFGKPTPRYKIQTPPFYAAWATPILHDTYAGLRVNEKFQVIDVFGNVISRVLLRRRIGGRVRVARPRAGGGGRLHRRHQRGAGAGRVVMVEAGAGGRQAPAHPTTLSSPQPIPREVEVGAEIALTVQVACPHGCDLRGLPVEITASNSDGAVAVGELAHHEDAANASGEIRVNAPRAVGEQAWTVRFPRHETEHSSPRGERASAPFPHRPARLQPDGVGRAFAHAGRRRAACERRVALRLRLWVGRSAGDGVRRDRRGTVGEGILGETPWPDTGALYWTAVDVQAPDAEGRACLDRGAGRRRDGAAARRPARGVRFPHRQGVRAPRDRPCVIEAPEPHAGRPAWRCGSGRTWLRPPRTASRWWRSRRAPSK